MKRISLDDLLHTRQNLTYQEQYGYKIYLFHMISVDYYLAHPDMYEKDRNWVLMLN